MRLVERPLGARARATLFTRRDVERLYGACVTPLKSLLTLFKPMPRTMLRKTL